MPRYTTKAALRARQGRLLVSSFAGRGAYGLLGTWVLALLAGALLAVPVRAQVIDLSTLDGTNGFRLDGIDAVDLSGALLLRGASISARTSALGAARTGSIQS